jgi:hypothetical protein
MKSFLDFLQEEYNDKKKKKKSIVSTLKRINTKLGNQGVVSARRLGPYGRYGPTRWQG